MIGAVRLACHAVSVMVFDIAGTIAEGPRMSQPSVCRAVLSEGGSKIASPQRTYEGFGPRDERSTR